MPLTGSVVEQMMARFRILFAYKKVKIKFKKAKCVSNRCNDLFKRKKYFGFRCTLNTNCTRGRAISSTNCATRGPITN